MELNKIQSSGNWGKAADDLNQNFSKVDKAVEQVKNATTRNKGYYSTDAALKSAFKNASLGDIAYVGSAYPYQTWAWNGSEWEKKNDNGGQESVNIGDYYTKEDIDKKLTELGSEVKYITGIQNYESGVKLNSNGTLSPQDNIGTSDFISVEVNNFYDFVAGGSNSGCLVVYDINKNLIDYWTGSDGARTIGTGKTGVFVRFSFVENNKNVALLYNGEVVWSPIHKGKLQDIDGKINTLSEQVKNKAEKDNVDLLASDVENIHSEINNLKSVQNYKSGLIQNSVGNTSNKEGVGLSEFIPVEAGSYYEFIAGSGSGYLVVFDENKNPIEYWAGSDGARTIGTGKTGVFVRFSFVENRDDVGLYKETVIWKPSKMGEIQRINESIEETRQSIVKIQSENSNITIGKYVASTGEVHDNPRCFIAKIDKSEIGTGWLVWKTSTLKEGVLAFYDINGNYLDKQWPNNGGGRSFSIGAIENAEYIIATFAIGDESSGVTSEENYIWKPEVDFGAKKLDAYDFNVYDIVTSNRWHHTELLQQLLRPERINHGNGGLHPKPVMIMHFTDNHGNNNRNLWNIRKFYDAYDKYIDDVLCTGDFIVDKWTDSFDFWNEEGMGFVLNTIGNHDVWDRTQPGVVYVSQKEAYDRYFAPYINSWMVTQPSNADAEGRCYYYKDYDWQRIRLIVLDCMNYDDNQSVWLTSILEDARNNNIAVVCASHYAPSLYISTFITDSSFTTEDRSFSSDALDNRAIEAVEAFIESGGEFIAWVTGHNHVDYLATLDGHGRQFVINSDNATNYNTVYCDSAKVQGTKSGDCFNCISFDRFSHTVRFVRIGVNYDMWMRKKETFCYDYKNNRMIYSD